MLEHETEELDERVITPDAADWSLTQTYGLMSWSSGVWPSTAPHHRASPNTCVCTMSRPPEAKDWTDDTARGIMKNRKYYGLLFRGLNPKSRIPGPQENAPAIFREDDHEAAVSPENWKKVNDGIKSRHKSRGPTRSHSSPNPLSNFLKCGHCAAQGIDSNLQLQKQNGKLSVRCSRKKKMGVDVCQFKSANLTTLLARIRDRLEHHFLTSENLAKVVDGVAEISRSMLEEKQTQLTHIRARKRVVNTKIQNINDVVELYGTQAKNLESLTNNLAKLEKESADLEKEGNQIDAATEEALLFVNDRDGIIETALDHKTWIDSADPEAIREFLKIFIEKVEVFELEEGATDQRAVIHYDLRAFKAVAEGTSPTETIHIGKKKSRDDASTNNCGLDGSTGITARHTRKVPVRLTLMVFTQSAMSLPCNGPMGPAFPALLTSTSIRPNRSTTLWANRSVSFWLVTSVRTAIASAPRSDAAVIASCSSDSLRAASASLAPSRA